MRRRLQSFLPVSGSAAVAAMCGCVLGASALNAQSAATSKPHFGVLLGANIATVSGIDEGLDVTFKKEKRIGANAGLFVNIPLSGMLSLQPEVHYSQAGVTIAADLDGETGKFGVQLDYVEVPVLFRLDLGSETSSIRPMLLAGASAAYRMRCKLTATASGASVTSDCDEDPESGDDFKKSDFGAVGGVGVAMKAGGRSISLQARYTLGLANIASDNSDPDVKPKNRVLALLLGIAF